LPAVRLPCPSPHEAQLPTKPRFPVSPLSHLSAVLHNTPELRRHADSATSAQRAPAIAGSCSIGACQSSSRLISTASLRRCKSCASQVHRPKVVGFFRLSNATSSGHGLEVPEDPNIRAGFPCTRDSPQQRRPHDSLSAVLAAHPCVGVGEVCHNLAAHSQRSEICFPLTLSSSFGMSSFPPLSQTHSFPDAQHRRDWEHGLPNPTEDIPTRVTDVMPASRHRLAVGAN
jgi:hypothetical protein